MFVRACVCVRVRACVRACLRLRAHVRVCVCVCVLFTEQPTGGPAHVVLGLPVCVLFTRTCLKGTFIDVCVCAIHTCTCGPHIDACYSQERAHRAAVYCRAASCHNFLVKASIIALCESVNHCFGFHVSSESLAHRAAVYCRAADRQARHHPECACGGGCVGVDRVTWPARGSCL